MASQFCPPIGLTYSSKSVITRLNAQCTVLARQTDRLNRFNLAPHQRIDTPRTAAGERDIEKAIKNGGVAAVQDREKPAGAWLMK